MSHNIKRNISDHILHYSRHNLFSFDKMYRLKALDLLPEEELQQQSEKEAMKMIRFAAERSEFYRNLYPRNALDGNFKESYEALPVIDKLDVREHEKTISTLPLRLLKKGRTSGTTGTPLTVYRSLSANIKEYAYVWYYRMQHGLKKGDPILSLRSKLNRDQLFHYNKAENILYFSPFLLSRQNIDKLMLVLADFKPKAILAYPSYIFNLVHLLNEKNFKIKVPLVFTSSETLHHYQRAKIEDFFGGRIFDWYGNVERTIALGQCDYGTYHEMPLYSYNEFTEGGVITTSLTNKAYPLIKYFVDDTITMMQEPCICGKNKGVKAIEGRMTDSLVLKDGTYMSGVSVGYSFIDVKNIRLAQIIQNTPDRIDVNVVPGEHFSQYDQTHLLNNLKLRLPVDISIGFHKVAEEGIIKSKSGKFKLVVSDFK
ncbi:MAG: hypothetical protein ABI687_01345 [Flavitalea sp.]